MPDAFLSYAFAWYNCCWLVNACMWTQGWERGCCLGKAAGLPAQQVLHTKQNSSDGTLYQLHQEPLLQARGKSGHQVHCFLNPSIDTTNTDSLAFSMKSSEIFQPMHFLWATEGSWNEGLQVSARNEQISRVQSTFPSLKTRSTFSESLQILDSHRHSSLYPSRVTLRPEARKWAELISETQAATMLQNRSPVPAVAPVAGFRVGTGPQGSDLPWAPPGHSLQQPAHDPEVSWSSLGEP